jgi:hypothetical protein
VGVFLIVPHFTISKAAMGQLKLALKTKDVLVFPLPLPLDSENR